MRKTTLDVVRSMKAVCFSAVFSILGPHAPARAQDDEPPKVVQPLPGRDTVKAMRPDWCQGAEIEDWLKGSNDAFRAVERSMGSGYSEKSLRHLAEYACLQPDDPQAQARVAAWRQGYVNLVGSSEKDDRESLKARVSKSWEAWKQQHCESIKPGDEAGPEEKALAEAMEAGTGCREATPLVISADGSSRELGWWVDTRTEVESELVRAVYVTRCLRILSSQNGTELDWPDPKSTWVMQAYATCGPDGRRLDRAKLEKELGDPKFNTFARVNARETFAHAKAVSDHLTNEFNKLAAKDEAYKKLLFDAPEAGWAEWEKEYTAHKDAFEAARAYERKFYGPSKKALQGCGETLRKNFSSYLRSKKPKAALEAKRAALDHVGYVLLEALALCDGVEGRLQLSYSEANFMNGEGEGPPKMRRGPRLAAYYATAAALGEILADRSKFPVKTDEFYLRIDRPREHMLDAASEYYTNKVRYAQDPKGTIAAVKKGKDGQTVTFKSVKTVVPNRICTPNGRIDRIEAGGKVVYDVDCHVEGNVTLTNLEQPMSLRAEVADGIKAGQTAIFSVDESPADSGQGLREGFPKEIYADKDMKKLVVWYGVSL